MYFRGRRLSYNLRDLMINIYYCNSAKVGLPSLLTLSAKQGEKHHSRGGDEGCRKQPFKRVLGWGWGVADD